MGPWTLDHLAGDELQGQELDWKVWQSVGDYLALLDRLKAENERGENLSGNQSRKREKGERDRKRQERWKRMRDERASSMDRLRKIANAR